MNINVRSWDWHDGRYGSDHCIFFGTLTPTDEFFIWDELKLPHAINTTDMIVSEMVDKSGDLKYMFNLIDPYANKIQSNVNTTVVQDINREFREAARSGPCKGGVWESWDSKSVLGRERLKMRLENSLLCEKPHQNLVDDKDLGAVYLPTIWIDYDKCPNVRLSIGKWSSKKTGEPEQKHSHFCTAIEAVLKDIRFKARMNIEEFEVHNPYAKYFHLRR